MQAEIITIGDEILIGQIVDSNSAFIGKELNKIGVDVYQISSVQDDKQHILRALEEAKDRVDIILITGGLGPTKDDITKHTLCEFFNDTLIQNDEVLRHVEVLFAKHIKRPISDVNKMQALVPSTSTVLMNANGTAPGMWLEKDNTIFVSMPGVPFEMKNLMKDEVLPRLQKKFDKRFIIHKTVQTYGMGESAIAQKIEQWEDALPSYIKLAYLPNLGRVRLRLSARGTNENLLKDTLQEKIKSLQNLIGDIIVGYEEDSIESLIGEILTSRGQSLAVAESCTGGKIAQAITANAGASKYFKGSIVSYATESKVNILSVSEQDIESHSVVSKSIVETMAVNVKKLFNTDYAISTTGNAGPSKGDSDADVGTVWIAIATENEVYSEVFNLGNHRDKVIMKATNKAFEMLQKEILKK